MAMLRYEKPKGLVDMVMAGTRILLDIRHRLSLGSPLIFSSIPGMVSRMMIVKPVQREPWCVYVRIVGNA